MHKQFQEGAPETDNTDDKQDFCGNQAAAHCLMVVGGRALYRDQNHLGVHGSRIFIEQISDALDAAVARSGTNRRE